MTDEESKDQLSAIVSKLTDVKKSIDNLDSTLVDIKTALNKLAGIEETSVPDWLKKMNIDNQS